MSSAIQCTVDALATYLAAQVTGLTVLKEWPNANQKIVYPSVTLMSTLPKLMNQAPYVLSKTTPSSHQTVVTYCCGQWDYKIQLDLWTRNKPERDTLFGQIKDAINKAAGDALGSPAGLSLQLTAYFNEWVRYDIDGMRYLQDEAAAERQEWRAMLDLLVNVREIRTRTLYAIEHLELEMGVNSDGSNFSDDTTGTTPVTVF